MPDPNYIDEIQFSDKTFKIRDSEARDLIRDIQILGGLPSGNNQDDILLWDNTNQQWVPTPTISNKSTIIHKIRSNHIDTGIIPGNNDIKIETTFKVNQISGGSSEMDVIFLIGKNSSLSVDGVALGIHNGKWNNLISGQDYGDSNITADLLSKSIVYQIIGNQISISGDLSITKTVNNLRTYDWQNNSIKLGFDTLSVRANYSVFKIYISNTLVFDMQPFVNEIFGLQGIINKVNGNKIWVNDPLVWDFAN